MAIAKGVKRHCPVNSCEAVQLSRKRTDKTTGECDAKRFSGGCVDRSVRPSAPDSCFTDDAYAATKNGRLTALADCERQAKAKRFGSNQTIQRRNLKNCMVERGFQGGIN
jgi:hypothetical protein